MKIVANVGCRTSAFIDFLIEHKEGLGITEEGLELDLITSDGYRIQNYYNPTSTSPWGPNKEQTLTLPHGPEIFEQLTKIAEAILKRLLKVKMKLNT
jgi:hypothetical protein